MPTIEYSVPVLSMSGRVGNSQMVFYKSHGRNFVRAFTPAANPASADQIAVRAIISAASKHWAALTAVQRAGWESYARAHFGRESNGQFTAPSGAQLYNKVAFFRQAQGLALPSTAPVFGPPPALSGFTQVGASDENQFVFAVHHSISTAANYKLLARITAPVGPGVTPLPTELRYIKGVAAASFLALPANGANADYSGARYSIPAGGAYRVELVVLSPESVPSHAAGALFQHAVV